MWRYRGQERPSFASKPLEGQESVWDYPRPPRLEHDSRLVEVRRGDLVIGRTRRAKRLLETASPPAFYLPGEDVATDLLRPVPGSSMCEWKGAARYWGLADRPGDIPVGWSYPAPRAAFDELRGYFSFYPGRIECYVDGERVRPQPGGFYGGWLTGEIVGPVKGEPGTGHW